MNRLHADTAEEPLRDAAPLAPGMPIQGVYSKLSALLMLANN